MQAVWCLPISGAAATSDSFTVTVSDGAGGIIGATILTFTVSPFIPPPGGGGGTRGSGGTDSGSGPGSGSGSETGGGNALPSIPPPFVPISTEAPVTNVSGMGVTEDPTPRAVMANRTFARGE